MILIVDYNYLNKLIEEVNSFRKQIAFLHSSTAECMVSYMPTKKTSFIGYKQGYNDIWNREQNGMKESDKIRTTVKDYLKYFKNKDGRPVQIESYKRGRLDVLFQVHWLGTVRYLFPFSAEGRFYPTYIYVTKYESDRVVEEYMVDGNQIIYEAYSHKQPADVEYTYINYVVGGAYPVRDERKGIFHLNPLTYEEAYSDNWLNHR